MSTALSLRESTDVVSQGSTALVPQAERPETPEPGVYFDVPEETYNSWTGSARSSVLSKLVSGKVTPAHVKWEMDNPSPSTPAQVLGRIIHAAVLEPDRFHASFARGPDVKLNTKTGKDEWAQAEQDNPGKELLRYSEWETAEAIVDSVWNNPEHEHVRNILLCCPEREVTVVWVDERSGVKCRARIDALGRVIRAKADVKTTVSAAVGAFESSIVEYGYHIQAALYRRACQWADWEIEDDTIVVIEKEGPFLCDNLRLSEPVLQIGDEDLSEALARYAEYERTGVWPGYGRKTKEASFPEWYWRRLNNRNGR